MHSANDDILIGALPHRRRRYCRRWHAIWHPINNRVVGEIVDRLTTGDLVRLDVTGIIDDRRQTIVHLVPTLDAQRYATEFTDQTPMAESLSNPAGACRYPNTALALANTSLWKTCGSARAADTPPPADPLPQRECLGALLRLPRCMPEEDEEALARLGSSQLAAVWPADRPLLDRKLHTNCGEQMGSRPGKINDDERRPTEINDDEPVRSRERL